MKIFRNNFTRLCLVLLAMLSTSTLKSEIRRGELGKNVHYEWDTRTEEVRIWGEGPMYDNEWWDAFSPLRESYIKTVVIEEGVTSISHWLFFSCSSLTSVVIPESITSIGYCAFYNCSSLTSINIPEGVTSIDWAFYGCSSLTSIVVDSKNKVYDSRENCNALIETATNTIIQGSNSSFIPTSVTRILGNAFLGCTGLISIEIPASITSIEGGTFKGCTGLSSIEIPTSITSIGGSAFYGCTGLTSIEIPANVTSIGGSAFDGCTGLTSIVVNSNNTVYDSRENCNAIIETSTNRMIFGCKTSVIPSSVTSFEFNALSFDPNATSIEIPEGVTSIGESGFANFKSLTSIKIPTSVTSIGNRAFEGCSSLTTIKIPSSVTSIGSSAFKDCSSLTSIEIPETIDHIADGTFYGCTSLVSIKIPEGVTYIQWDAFRDCTSLASVKLPEGIKTIENYAFYGCKALTSIEIPKSVFWLGGFQECTSLSSIEIPEGVYGIEGGAFSGCTSLTSIKIPASVEDISQNPFCNCTALQSIVVDDKNIKYDSRENCNAIISKRDNTLISTCSSTVIPESVKIIGQDAFYSLTSIHIPETIERIETYAFYKCPDLSTVILGAALPPEKGSDSFTEETKKWCKLYVPKGSRGAYIDSGWYFYNILEYSDISEIPISDDSSSPAENPAKYDLNGDFRVSTADVTKLVDYIMKHPEL